MNINGSAKIHLGVALCRSIYFHLLVFNLVFFSSPKYVAYFGVSDLTTDLGKNFTGKPEPDGSSIDAEFFDIE